MRISDDVGGRIGAYVDQYSDVRNSRRARGDRRDVPVGLHARARHRAMRNRICVTRRGHVSGSTPRGCRARTERRSRARSAPRRCGIFIRRTSGNWINQRGGSVVQDDVPTRPELTACTRSATQTTGSAETCSRTGPAEPTRDHLAAARIRRLARTRAVPTLMPYQPKSGGHDDASPQNIPEFARRHSRDAAAFARRARQRSRRGRSRSSCRFRRAARSTSTPDRAVAVRPHGPALRDREPARRRHQYRRQAVARAPADELHAAADPQSGHHQRHAVPASQLRFLRDIVPIL